MTETYPTVKPSSYLLTESLETQDKVINLGKKLIDNFSKNDDDIIIVWMTNYLAEQILLAENGCTEAKKECFDTILTLWEKKAIFPQGLRPFESFENVIDTLELLKIENNTPRYKISRIIDECSGNVNNDNNNSRWLESVKSVDDSAKQLINYCLEQAIKDATDDETREWLSSLMDNLLDDFIASLASLSNDEKTDEEKYVESLKQQLVQIQELEALCQQACTDIEEEINKNSGL